VINSLFILLLLLTSLARAGDVSTSQGAIGASENEGLTFCGIPDLQNYCASWDPSADSVPPQADRAEGIRQLRLMAEDIIAERPEFCIQVGDITDTTGGSDSDGTAGHLDDLDNYVVNRARYDGEWQCVYDNLFKLLYAANIRVLEDNGNHDSCIDHERTLPAATFATRSYYHSHQARAARCGSGGTHTDTMQRAALFTTSIGNICAVAGRFNGAENDATDIAWVNAAVGCGGTTPTILSNHNGLGFTDATYGGAANSEVFAALSGHFTPLGLGGSLQTASGGHQLASIGLNWQESSRNCQNYPTPSDQGAAMHTGVGFWVKFRLVPRTSTLHMHARSPVFGGANKVRLGCNYNEITQNGALTFSPTLCSRFPTLKGC
jgi:hypothetical protein